MTVHEETIEGVVTDSPTVPIGTQTAEPGTQPVNTDVAPADEERPIANLKGEMDRKFSRIEQMIAELAFANRPPQQVDQPQTRQSDDDVAKLAVMGDSQAQMELTNRLTQRALAAERVQRAINDQLRSVYTRYPQLTDPANPLTVAALRAKTTLRNLGQWPSEQALDLEAIKSAIVDNPELVTPRQAVPQSQHVPAATVTGSTNRQVPARPGEPVITQKEIDLARRMGAKDPIAFIKKAKKGFEDRQAAGRSGIDPAAAIIIREQEGR